MIEHADSGYLHNYVQTSPDHMFTFHVSSMSLGQMRYSKYQWWLNVS